MIKKMIEEEWRKNSALYRGRSFAAFPVLVFFFSFAWNWMALNFSVITAETLQNFVLGLSAFLGLGVGAVGFSSRDAFRNVLGRTNYLVFTSRTLPISRKSLITSFVVKDIFYYSVLMVLPIIAGFLILAGLNYVSVVYMAPLLFLGGILVSTVITVSSLTLPSNRFLNYGRLSGLRPLSAKSVLDLFRSSGGFLKILFSVGLLTAFYWTLVLYFPVTSIFLSNPLLSYSVIMGLVSLTVYNWLNRFDELEDYTFLPLDLQEIMKSKKQAYTAVAVPVSVSAVLISGIFYSGHLLLGVFTTASMTVYNMAVASHITGLKPNEKLFHADAFIKYMLGIGVILIPQLYLSVAYTPELLPHILIINTAGLLIGLYSYSR
ncbi:hypothetical protein ACK3SF_03545 [Candidatus Nanosalina sp. VS9-1]|uniref:hypothetical protein n=1 Tax=Candidatus Nanosalina sp. VS9-1 TaxID=3388566 RepID=UPI0039E0200B